MVRNDGVTWTGVWFGMRWCLTWNDAMSVKCGGNDEVRDAMAMRYTFHISPPQLSNSSHQTTFPAQQTYHTTPVSHQSRRISHSFNWPPDHTSHGVMWNSVVWHLVWSVLQCQMRDVVPYSS